MLLLVVSLLASSMEYICNSQTGNSQTLGHIYGRTSSMYLYVKEPMDIQGEKSSKDQANSGYLVSSIET